MSYLLKDIYSVAFYEKFSAIAGDVIPSYDRKKFIQSIFDKNWKQRELKDRMKHTSFVLHQFLPDNFETAATMIEKMIDRLEEKRFIESSLEFMFLPDYLETYGIDHFDASVKSIERVTQFTSCEFAVRPFIIRYGDKMVNQMHRWSLHENHKVRRLSSEGIRPRLPWAIALPELKKNPAPILPLLENLKNDTSEFVRRSVANNLNDISKDHPGVVISIVKKWKGIGKETDALIKHGCRTLLKKGHPEILKFYRLSNSDKLKVCGFKILTPKVKIGESLEFLFTVHNQELKAQTIRLEYGIYYLRQNGTSSKKVFKISERILQSNEKIKMTKKQSFKIITTRKFYKGQHQLSLIVNGLEKSTAKFELE